MMPHVLTRSLDRAATIFILVVAALGVLIPLSNLLLPAGSAFQVAVNRAWAGALTLIVIVLLLTVIARLLTRRNRLG